MVQLLLKFQGNVNHFIFTEITKEEEEKINKFQQNLRASRNQRHPQHFPGKRGGPQFKKNQHSFQQHGPRQQFRPQNNAGNIKLGTREYKYGTHFCT